MRTGTVDDALLALNPDALIATDAAGRVVRWNSGAHAVFGFSDDEAMGRSLEELTVPPDRREEHRALLRGAVSLAPVRSETVRRRKNGALLYVEILTQQVTLAGDTYVLFSKRDITDRRQADEMFRGLLESAPDAVVIVGQDGRINLVNSQADTMFGYPREELLGQQVEVLLPDSARGLHVQHRAGYFGQPRVRAMGAGLILNGRHRDGREFPVEISLSPLVTETGMLVSAAIRDITERRRVQRQLEENNLQLADANLAKTHFLASMSHELRTPLNAIIGFTGTLLMLLAGPLTQEQTRQLRTVQAAGMHLLALINDLLNLSRIEARQTTLQLQETDCAAMAAMCIDEIQPLAGAKGLDVIFHDPGEVLVVNTDQKLLHQILLNLLGNAVKYTERGHVRLQLRSSQTGEHDAVTFEVSDSGIGIAPEDHGRLFHAFSQLDQPGRPTEGVGLGLYLSAKLAQTLGGAINFCSTLGAGSTFSVTLPVALPGAHPVTQPAT